MQIAIAIKDAIKRWLKEKGIDQVTDDGIRSALKELESQLSIYKTGRN
jgi:hypothetical protein